MTAVFTHDTYQLASGILAVLLDDMGEGSSAWDAAVAAWNTAVGVAGESWTFPTDALTASSAQLVMRRSGEIDPGDCPRIQIPLQDWQVSSAASGAQTQGEATHTFIVEGFLKEPAAVGSLTSEEVLARQAMAFDSILTHALRRRDGYGLWGTTAGSLINIERVSVEHQVYTINADFSARAARIITTWEAVQDARY